MIITHGKHSDVEENNNTSEPDLKYTFPYNVNDVDPVLNQMLLEDFTGERTGFVQVGPKKWFFPSKYKIDAKYYYNFEVRPDDTWVVTFPRSGTTWTQELVWLIANNLDFKMAKSVDLPERFPFLEFSTFIHAETKAEFIANNINNAENILKIEQIAKPGWQAVAEITSPRFIKTHLPFSLLPPNLLDTNCKIIYVARNPREVAVSFYHLNRLIKTQGYKGDFVKYWNYFENNLHPWMPYWEHIKEGWEKRANPNVLFMFYEEMKKDLPTCIERVAKFLGKELTKSEIDILVAYLAIENFSKNEKVNMTDLKELGILNTGEQGFVRKGESGKWQDEYTPELKARAEKWIEEHLQFTDLCFPS